MKDYSITCKVTGAVGKQVWTVEAESEADARRLFDAGDAEMESEQVEVVSVEVESIEEI